MGVATSGATTATATAGADVVGNHRVANDAQGRAGVVVDTADRAATGAADRVVTITAAPTADGQSRAGRRAAGRAGAVARVSSTAGATAGVTAPSAHVEETTAGTALSGRADGARGIDRVAAPTTGTAANRTATTAAATGILRRHATTATTARSGVRGDRDVLQGQGPGVVDTTGLGNRSIDATIATVTRHHATGNHQAIEGRRRTGCHVENLGTELPIEGDIGDVVVIEVAVDGHVPVDHQHLGQRHGHAAAEGHDVTVLRRGQGRTQRADTGVGVVGGGPGGKTPLIIAHRAGGQYVGAFDVAGGNFQVPVAAQTGTVVGCGHIAAGQLRQRIDQLQATLALGGVAAIDQDIATGVHVLADLGQHLGAGLDVVRRQIGIAQPQITGVAVGDDLHRADALVGVQVIGDLLQAVLGGVQLHDLGAGRHAFEQAGGILDPGIDEYHRLARHGGLGGIGLALGRVSIGSLIGRGRLGRVGGGMGVRLRGVGHGRCDGAVEQHPRFQGHDHWRCKGLCALGYPRFTFAPPHDVHPDSNCLNV
ncbi:hypothetical protein SRABI112_02922 [Pseudomonas mediterranea]|nr:hypothetical protein SRABI112_02922 [Pseudomonas mediterranea]